jgi:hypothetical protein
MLPFFVVEAQPGTDPGPRPGGAGISVEVDLLVFQTAPQPLDENIVHAAAPAIHADHDAALFEDAGELGAGELGAGELGAGELAAPRFREGRLWSVLKISGLLYRAKASSRASTQKSAPSVFDSRHASTARLTPSIMTTR